MSIFGNLISKFDLYSTVFDGGMLRQADHPVPAPAIVPGMSNDDGETLLGLISL